MVDTTRNYQNLQKEIRSAAAQANRPADNIKLVAVSKKHSAAAIRELYALGQRAFAENTVQEAQPKITALSELALEWHFIGHIQSNKTQAIAHQFDWVQSVDRQKLLQRLHDQRPQALPPLNILLQINISAEASKSGISLDELPALAASCQDYSRLRLRGLMAIPGQQDASTRQLAFAAMHTAYKQLQQIYHQVDTLSLGMSNDFALAIQYGATMVRVGTRLFGAREA